MASWDEVLRDRTAYPDEMKVQLREGVEVTLKEMRDKSVSKADFTKVTQESAAERQALLADKQRAEAALAQALGTTKVPTGDKYAALRNDETFGPLVRDLEEATAGLKASRDTLRQHELTFWANQHLKTLDTLAQHDKTMHDPAKRNALLQYAADHKISDLSIAYAAQTRDEAITKAREEGRTAGLEEGKKQARIPIVPAGMRAASPPAAPVAKTMDEVDGLAKQDTDIAAIFAGEGA